MKSSKSKDMLVSVDCMLNNIAVWSSDKNLSIYSLSNFDAENKSLSSISYNDVDIFNQIDHKNAFYNEKTRKRSNMEHQKESKKTCDNEYFITVEKSEDVNEEFKVGLYSTSHENSYFMKPGQKFNTFDSNSLESHDQCAITSICVNQAQSILYTGCHDGSILSWCLVKKGYSKASKLCKGAIKDMTMHPNSRNLLVLDTYGKLYFCDCTKNISKLFIYDQIDVSIEAFVDFKLFNEEVLIYNEAESARFLKTRSSDFYHVNSFTKGLSLYDAILYKEMLYIANLDSGDKIEFYVTQKSNEDSKCLEKPVYIVNLASEKKIKILSIKLVHFKQQKNICCVLCYSIGSKHRYGLSMIFIDELQIGENTHLVEFNKKETTRIREQLEIDYFSSSFDVNANNENIQLSASSISETLTQVVKSNDDKLLEEIMRTTSIDVIDNTIRLIDSSIACKLLLVITQLIEVSPSRASELMNWIKLILQHHLAFFINSDINEETNPLNKLERLMKNRSKYYAQLCKTRGCLSLLTSMHKNYNTTTNNADDFSNPLLRIDENDIDRVILQSSEDDASCD